MQKTSALAAAVLCLSLGACVTNTDGGDDDPAQTGDAGNGSSGAPASSSAAAGSSSSAPASSAVDSSSNGAASSNASSAMASSSTGALSSASSAAPSSSVVPPCSFAVPMAEDAPRVILVSHPFTEDSSHATEIRSLTLNAEGSPVDDGVRLDVGFETTRMVFFPSGKLALLVGANGQVATLAVDDAQHLSLVHQANVSPSGFEDVILSEDSRNAYGISFDSQATGGIRQVGMKCDGTFTEVTSGFVSMRLAMSAALVPGQPYMWVVGGQVLGFEPMDTLDTRFFALGSSGIPTQMATLDLWTADISSSRIALAPQGDLLVVPNGALFSDDADKVRVFSVNNTAGTATLAQEFNASSTHPVSSPKEATFSPDGQTLLVTRAEVSRISVFKRNSAGLLDSLADITNVGIPDQVAWIARGTRAGTAVLAGTNSEGNVALLRVTDPGVVTVTKFNLGAGSINIPDAIAVAP